MATTFRIHEDIDNALDLNKENKLISTKSNGNDKEARPKLAILNNLAYDGRAHAQKMVKKKYFLLSFIYSTNNRLCLSK